MKRFDEIYVKLVRMLNDIAGFLLLAVSCLVFIHVLMRAFFNLPILGIYEIVQYGIFVIVVLGLANNELEGGNVTVTFLTDRMKPKTSNLFSIIMYVAASVIMALLTVNQTRMITSKLNDGAVTTLLKIPHWILMVILVIGLFTIVLSCVLKVVRMIGKHKGLSVKSLTAEELALQMDINAEF